MDKVAGGTAPGGPGIAVVGSGIPSATQENQAYVIATGTDPEQFVMMNDPSNSNQFNNSVGNPGTSFQTNLNLTYVATDNGVEKYVFDGTNWNKTETIAPTNPTSDNKITTELVGLTYAGKDDSGNNVLYATTAGDFRSGTNEGNALLRLVDTGPSATWQVVEDSTTNTWLRGVAAIDEAGDTNGDFHVDSSDFATLAANYGQAVTGGYASGDFNYDGTVNALDFNALANDYGYDPNSALPGDLPDSALGSVVPEPMGL